MKTSKSLANRFLIMGGSGIVVSIAISIISLLNLYGKIGSACDVGSGDSCNISTEQLGVRLAVILFYASVVTLFIGLAMRIYIARHQNKT